MAGFLTGKPRAGRPAHSATFWEVVSALVLGVWLATVSAAAAHQSPAGCRSTNLDLDLAVVNPAFVIAGVPTSVTYLVRVFNGGGYGCDVTAEVTFRCPGPTGFPTKPLRILSSRRLPAASLTPSIASGVGVTLTASPGVFTFADFGKSIRNLVGTGRATISAVNAATTVVATITQTFPSTLPVASGNWSVGGDDFLAVPVSDFGSPKESVGRSRTHRLSIWED